MRDKLWVTLCDKSAKLVLNINNLEPRPAQTLNVQLNNRLHGSQIPQ